MQDADTSPRTPYQVSELLGLVQHRLDGHFGLVRVEGEISGLSQPRSGHRYFALKDSDGQLRCAWFRHAIRGQAIREGEQVLVHGKLAIYSPRGDFQLIVQSVEPAGEGALAAAFARLKRKLELEGLFDPAKKPPVPVRIRRLGIVSSPNAAALQDVLVTLRRRDPFMQVQLYPSSVQGPQAHNELVDALAQAAAEPELDVILLTRGGGSLEDLQAFNNEELARAIALCPCPVVSAVGHETDLTIADCVASLRAPTPTAAAELLSPDRSSDLKKLGEYRRRLSTLSNQLVQLRRDQLQRLQRQLQLRSPQRRLDLTAQRLDEARTRLFDALHRQLQHKYQRRTDLHHRLQLRQPKLKLIDNQAQLSNVVARLERAYKQQLQSRKQQIHHQRSRLQSLSPEAVLERGYALVYRGDTLVTRQQHWPAQADQLEVQWADGRQQFQVQSIKTRT